MQKNFLMRVIRWFFVILCSALLAIGGSFILAGNAFSLFPVLFCICLLSSYGIIRSARSDAIWTGWLFAVLVALLSSCIYVYLSDALGIVFAVSAIGGGIIHQLCRIARTLAEINRTLNKQATSKISPRDFSGKPPS